MTMDPFGGELIPQIVTLPRSSSFLLSVRSRIVLKLLVDFYHLGQIQLFPMNRKSSLAAILWLALTSTVLASGGGGGFDAKSYLTERIGTPISQEIVDAVTEGAAKGSYETSDLVLLIIFATVAIGFSFLCSIAEAVVLSVSPSYIANLKNSGKASGERIHHIKENIDRTLAGILTLNTIAHTVGSGGAGAYAAKYFGQAQMGMAMTVLTLLILFLSEIIPKTIGATYWRSLAPMTAWFVQALTFVLYPLIWISEMLTKILTGGKTLHGMTREEFTALADIGAEGGQLDLKESRIVKNLMRFPELRAQDIMTPRTVVFALQQDKTVAEVMEKIRQTSFSRIPIYTENKDEITGFVLKTDVLLNERKNDGAAHLRDLKREIRAVNQDTKLSDVLEELLDNRAHIMIVVDYHGGTQGIVTLEDVVETLIGIEIVDEVDQIDDMRILARRKWEERMKKVGIDVREPLADASSLSNSEETSHESTELPGS